MPRAPSRPTLATIDPETLPPLLRAALRYAMTGEPPARAPPLIGSEQAALREPIGVVALACRGRAALDGGRGVTASQIAALAGLSSQAVARHVRAGLRLDNAAAVRAWLTEREAAQRIRASRRRSIGRRS